MVDSNGGEVVEIGEKLKQCRSQKQLTQADVAEKLHVSRKTVSGWETGRSYPDIKMLVKLATLFDISLDDLLNNERALDHYEKQGQLGQNSTRIFRWAYWATALFLILGYVDLFRPGGFHTIIIPVGLLIAVILLMSHYTGWRKFQRIRVWMTCVVLFTVSGGLTGFLVSISPEFLRIVSAGSAFENTGFMLARFMLIVLLSTSLCALVFLREANIEKKR